MCVCSDTCSYGMNNQEGSISMLKGDIINFRMDFDIGKFTVTGPNNKYIYYSEGLKGNQYVAFIGLSSGSTSKLTMKGK